MEKKRCFGIFELSGVFGLSGFGEKGEDFNTAPSTENGKIFVLEYKQQILQFLWILKMLDIGHFLVH